MCHRTKPALSGMKGDRTIFRDSYYMKENRSIYCSSGVAKDASVAVRPSEPSSWAFLTSHKLRTLGGRCRKCPRLAGSRKRISSTVSFETPSKARRKRRNTFTTCLDKSRVRYRETLPCASRVPGSGIAVKAGSRLEILTHIYFMPMTLNARLEGTHHMKTLRTYGKSVSPLWKRPIPRDSR